MTLPDNLITAYTALGQSALVQRCDTSREALLEFARHLNAAQPVAGCIAARTVGALYSANRRGYLACIRGTVNAATVLWTDPRTVVAWFSLSRICYIKQKEGRFWVHAITDDAAPRAAKPRAKAKVKSEDLDISFPEIRGDEIVIAEPSK